MIPVLTTAVQSVGAIGWLEKCPFSILERSTTSCLAETGARRSSPATATVKYSWILWVKVPLDRWQVPAWCLMHNHLHLLLETPQPNLAEGMRWFLGVYTTLFNLRQKEFGHLFDGRYQAGWWTAAATAASRPCAITCI